MNIFEFLLCVLCWFTAGFLSMYFIRHFDEKEQKPFSITGSDLVYSLMLGGFLFPFVILSEIPLVQRFLEKELFKLK